jgi:hypothetical protein
MHTQVNTSKCISKCKQEMPKQEEAASNLFSILQSMYMYVRVYSRQKHLIHTAKED